MIIKTAEFISSMANIKKCPEPNKPEYAFIGRSNVGKSSLINMLVNKNKLAKTSSRPGKTQTINHFLINEQWYLVDLPGYGYARVAKTERAAWSGMIKEYLMKRENLMCVFVLIDSRIEPQKLDLDFMENLGINGIPFVMVYTKTDKISTNTVQTRIAEFNKAMKELWEEMPIHFITSSELKSGRNEILEFINDTNKLFNNQ